MTNNYVLDAKFSFTFEGEGEPDIVGFLDHVVEHLETLGADDVFIVSDENGQTFLVSQVIASNDGETIETVVGKGMGLLRTSFHACDGSTPGWPTAEQALLSVHIAPVELHPEPTAETAKATPVPA